ncbi:MULTISPECIES: hypothetical protein [Delftia]|uniref:hypothetical protein n=1 Tax=Delftia TaxID=80865 RepID=UPI0000E8E32C|nr:MULTISPECIES: hypothetical protein [Delftia]MCP4017710.1 hypothetical protein [Delftia sp.]MCP4532853.1 hypothetical protein [Delftia sp.]QPS72665.1 hypothetical protein I6G48_18465 [Delftia acidovorans]
MINNIYYPVEFIVQQEHRYALWVEGDGGDGFLKDVDSGSVVYAKTKFKLYEMSEREKLNVNFEEVFKINVDLVRGLIDSIDSCVAVDAGKCFAILDFFNISQDLARAAKRENEAGEDVVLGDILVKLFEGCDLPSMKRKAISPLFNNDEILQMRYSHEKYRQLIAENFSIS